MASAGRQLPDQSGEVGVSKALVDSEVRAEGWLVQYLLDSALFDFVR